MTAVGQANPAMAAPGQSSRRTARNAHPWHIRGPLRLDTYKQRCIRALTGGKEGVIHVNIMDSKYGMISLDVLQLKNLDLQEVDLDQPDCSAVEA